MFLVFACNLRFSESSKCFFFLKKKLILFFLIFRTKFVACSFNENWTFEEQIELEGRALKSTMLLWDIEDVNYTSPVLELESPYEITCFEFHPTNPYIIIGISQKNPGFCC